MLEECGVRVAVLSDRDSRTLRRRVADLGMSLHCFGVKDKAQACIELIDACSVTREQTVCIGDDSIDLPAFSECGLSYAVADAPIYVKRQATAELKIAGGYGAFRELADAILEAQGKPHVFNSAESFQLVMAGMAQ